MRQRIRDRIIKDAKHKVFRKLSTLDLNQVPVSDYNKNYIESKKQMLSGTLDLYADVLDSALQGCSKISDFCLVDYGAGSGILTILAIEAGVGKVIYNDIYDVSCQDVKNLVRALNINNLEDIVCGDISSMITYLKRHSILIDAIVSCDVIEHIYSPQKHFSELSKLQDQPFKIVYSSDANSENPFAVKKLSNKHKEIEFKSRVNRYGVKKRDTLQSYWSVRRKIIKAYSPNLSSKELDDLATRTRGLVKKDIHFLVKEFQATGKVTYVPNHPTNTCDPYTGNWCEHLMDFEWLIEMSAGYGFDLSIKPGYFQQTGKSPLKNLIKKMLNNAIRLGGRKTLAIAPRYTLHGHFLGSTKPDS